MNILNIPYMEHLGITVSGNSVGGGQSVSRLTTTPRIAWPNHGSRNFTLKTPLLYFIAAYIN